MADFILANPEKCIGCRTCEVACVQAHLPRVLPEEIEQQDRFFPRLRVQKLSTVSVPVACHHCERAPCVAVCPVAALTQEETSVKADAALCIGCNNCVIACPFGAISIEQTSSSRQLEIVKCDLCDSYAESPACVTVCPTKALIKVSSSDLARLTRQRLEKTAAESSFKRKDC